MIIKRYSKFSGKQTEMDLPVSEEDILEYEQDENRNVNEHFSTLNPQQKEFIVSGMTEEEWDQMLGI